MITAVFRHKHSKSDFIVVDNIWIEDLELSSQYYSRLSIVSVCST